MCDIMEVWGAFLAPTKIRRGCPLMSLTKETRNRTEPKVGSEARKLAPDSPLELRVELVGSGVRKLVSDDPEVAKHIQKDGKRYYDGSRRVRLFRQQVGDASLPMVGVSLHKYDRRPRTYGNQHVKFQSGELMIWLDEAELRVEYHEYFEMLCSQLGIANGYKFNPARSNGFDVKRKGCFLEAASDGLVKRLSDATVYVYGYTWIVFCEYDPTKARRTKIWLCTNSERLDEIIPKLRTYLEREKMPSFRSLAPW